MDEIDENTGSQGKKKVKKKSIILRLKYCLWSKTKIKDKT